MPGLLPVKFKLIIAYDGTGYAGWQAQKTGVGVQQRVEEAIGKIFPGASRLHSSSRTDAGVHALGMAAQVEIPDDQIKMPAAKMAVAVNAHLPRDIRVMAVARCRAGFDARFDARGKQYRYFALEWAGDEPAPAPAGLACLPAPQSQRHARRRQIVCGKTRLQIIGRHPQL